MPDPPAVSGIVTLRDGPHFRVDAGGVETRCAVRGRLRQGGNRVTSVIVVGDRVRVRLLADGGGVIEEVLSRRTELARPGFKGLVHVIAANVDQLLIVQAAAQPAFKRHLVERFLATARRGGIAPLVVVNKCDLAPPEEVSAWVAPLRETGVPVLLAGAVSGQGVADLRECLAGRVSVLAGQSGVGKSSLLNAMFPGFEARTGAVSESLNKGRHTTSSSRLYPLPGGGYLADTPGIRELGLFDDDRDHLPEVFPEILAAAAECRFRDCTHSHESRCAVKAAVERGEIHADRYEHFLRLAAGE